MAVSGGANGIFKNLILAYDAANLRSYPTTGTTVSDVSENGNNGTLVGGLTFSDGLKRFDTNATSITDANYLSCQQIEFADGDEYTIEFMVKLRDGVGSTFHSLCGRGSTSPWVAINGTPINWRFSFRESDGTYRYSSYVTDYNISQNWIHLVMSVSLDRNIAAYYNGEFFENLPTPTNSSLTINRIAGGYSSGGNFYSLQGSIVFCKIYNKPLSSEEVLQSYNATKSRFGL